MSSERRKPRRPRQRSAKSNTPHSDGTICAIATPVGEGGIGVIRLSGARAVEIAGRVFQPRSGKTVQGFRSHSIHLGAVRDPSTGERLDEAMLAVMRAPKTYTRMDTVEVYCHGGGLLLHRVLDLLLQQGARLAEPGEFTKWAFLNGRIDLTQAEAVMDLIRAKTDASQRAALAQLDGAIQRRIAQLREESIHLLAEIEAGIDFTEEEIQFLSSDQINKQISSLIDQLESLLKTAEGGKALREGIATAIIGRPNVGKSSLLNALLMQNRAIVTPVPGTTRDIIEEYLNLNGIPIRIIDTAGIRDTDDLVEREGVIRTRQAVRQADLLLLVLDLTQEISPEERMLIEETANKKRLIVFNKADLRSKGSLNRETTERLEGISGQTVYISAITGHGLEDLKSAILEQIRTGIVLSGEREAMINTRHKSVLLTAKAHLISALTTVNEKAHEELIAVDIRAAVDRLGEITGTTATEDLLDRIFKEFCIGK
jgi:tRNA modification GTPase